VNPFALNLLQKLREEKGNDENLLFSPLSICIALNMLLLGAKNETRNQIIETLLLNKAFDDPHDVHSFLQQFIANESVPESKDEEKAPSEEGEKDGDKNEGKSDMNEWEKIMAEEREKKRKFYEKEFGSSSKRYALLLGNRALISTKYSALETFREQLQNIYGALINEVDFVSNGEAIVKDVNQWVEKQTKGNIKSILSEVDPDTVLILLNAVYFKGLWFHPFEIQATNDKTFFNFGDKSRGKSVPFMRKKEDFYLSTIITGNGEEATLLEMPYEGDISMYLVIPREVNGLQKILQELTSDHIEDGIRKLRRREIDLNLPKFKFEAEFNLIKSLKKMGMNLAFDPKLADLKGITDRVETYVSEVLHKATVEVDEKGTVATAVTGMRVRPLSMPRPPLLVTVDRPFLFMIRHKKSGLNLFMGTVNQL
jgi:serpin B